MTSREDEFQRRNAEHEAIKSLCRSLIVRALRDLVTYRGSKKVRERRLYEEAHEWIFDGHHIPNIMCENPITLPHDDQQRELFVLDALMSFNSICAILGWDADLVRKRAETLNQADLDRIGPNLMDL